MNTWPVVLDSEADAEMLQAYDWYAQRNPDAGHRFRLEFREAIRRIADRPDRWPIFDGEVRRHLLHKFPFAILYYIAPDIVIVVAVMHLRRQPGYWKDRP